MSEVLYYDDYNQEIINGEIHLMSPSATPKHSYIILNLANIFKKYLKGKS